jgi:hypothetical protein
MLLWLRERSKRRDEGPEGARNPNVLKFALQHTFITLDWTEAYSWKVNTRKQIIFLPEMNTFFAAAPGARGDLDESKALAFVNTFTNCSRATYDEYTSMHSNISILRSDPTRPELYNCTCANNAKKFTCVHSLGVAIMRGILVAPRAAQVQLLGRKRRRGRRRMAAPAWKRMKFEIQTPVQHPQQNNAILLGPPVADIATDLIAE